MCSPVFCRRVSAACGKGDDDEEGNPAHVHFRGTITAVVCSEFRLVMVNMALSSHPIKFGPGTECLQMPQIGF